MAKNAYLIISDLHDFCKNLDNRYDYPGEINQVKEKIIELGMLYRERGFNVTAVLMGDVNNRSFNNVNGAILNNNYWIVANKLFEKIYSVLGNHETTYYNSNPFFTLVNKIESDKVKTLHNKVWQPIGMLNTINVVDKFDDGEVAFHFNHYGCPITYPDKGQFNIGLFHTDFVFSEIAKASEDVYHMNAYVGKSISAKNNELLELYDICFFAHHHKLYGCWNITTDTNHKCIISHLASLGRPNVTEVDDNFLERNIPVVIVEDGKFVTVEDNKFNLPSRAECVREDIVELNHVAYERTKALQLAKDYSPTSDDPIENVKTFCSTDTYLMKIFTDLIEHDKDGLSQELEEEIKSEGITIWN